MLVRSQEHVNRSGRRRRLPIVDRNVLVVVCQMHQHETAAPDIAGLWDSHREREADRHRGINGIAAPFQDVKPDAGRLAVLARNHPVASGRHLGCRNAGAFLDWTVLKRWLSRQSDWPRQSEECYERNNRA